MNHPIKITFLGTGTSQGVPVIACDCEVCLSNDPKDARLRCSILIETQGKYLVVDTGPDFRQQMLRAKVPQIDAILFTHEHKDHTAGLDDVRAYNFKHKTSMELFVDERVDDCLRREYSYIFSDKKYPGVPEVNLNRIINQPFIAAGVHIQPIELMHYKLPVFGFRIGDFAYCTDVNYIADEEMAKLQNLDVLVITALRREPHISHFSLSESLAIIDQLKPKKAYLTHISHLLGCDKEVSLELPENVFLAYDNLTIEI